MFMTLKHTIADLKAYSSTFFKWLFIGGVTGVLCGGVGAAFSKAIAFASSARAANGWLIFLLPVGGLLTVAIYRFLRVEEVGTNQVLKSVSTSKQVSPLLAPAVFAAAFITHLCGGSAGKEGAALQLGGSVTTLLGKLFRLCEADRHIITICGMGAFFAAVFGTPLGACVFALEVASVGTLSLAAIFPVFVSGISAYGIAHFLGTEAERFHLYGSPLMSVGSLLKVLVIAVAGAVVSLVFCHALHYAEHTAKKYLKNDILRIVSCGALIVVLSLIFGNGIYNGSGVEVIHGIFADGSVEPEAFLLKMLFTVITVAAGFKGGEIIPTLFIGASLGAVIAPLLGMTAAFGASVGMTALFCGVTNCPLASVFLSVELFGEEGMIYFAIASAVSFLLSGNSGLYTEQKINTSKLNDSPI